MATRRRAADLEAHSWESVTAREVQRLAVVAPPFVGLALALPVAIGLRELWPGVLAASVTAELAAVVAVLLLYLTHARRGFGRYFAALTALLAGCWVAWVQAAGIGIHPLTITGKVYLEAGAALALSWAVWLHIHEGGDEAGMSRPFGKAALKAGFDGVRLIKSKRVGAKVVGQVVHDAVTQDDMRKGVPAIEASWPGKRPMPPGALILTGNEDDAKRSHFTYADPRALNKPIDWPGPSAPGQSIAVPVRVGLRQDGTEDRHKAYGYHEQVMAMTGAGKTLGYMFSELGEVITRRDVAVFGVDLMKRRQFFGAMEGALHYLATTPEQLLALLDAVNGSVPARTDYLGDRDLGNWEQDCGLTHCELWIEEAADAFEKIDGVIDELLFPLLRAARSAGWRIVYSLHRASYDQMPTFLKDMVALTTMGVRNASHSKFGLSTVQYEGECEPHRWADEPKHQGKYFRDAPGVAAEYKLMANRSYSWGSTTTRMREHAANYPASGRPLDEVTLPFFQELMGQVHQRQATAAPVRPVTTLTDASKEGTMRHSDRDDDELLAGLVNDTTTDDDIELSEAEGELPIGPRLNEPETPVSREVALDRIRTQIRAWRASGRPQPEGEPSRWFAARHLSPLTREIGRQRTWLYTVMPQLEDEGEIRRDGDGWTILDKAA